MVVAGKPAELTFYLSRVEIYLYLLFTLQDDKYETLRK
jgi:hypothetical protein